MVRHVSILGRLIHYTISTIYRTIYKDKEEPGGNGEDPDGVLRPGGDERLGRVSGAGDIDAIR